MQNMFSQPGNDSKCFLKKSFFRIRMWNSRPPHHLTEKSMLNFHFDYLTTSLSDGDNLMTFKTIFKTLNASLGEFSLMMSTSW